MKDRLIALIQDSVNGCAKHWAEIIADYLLANGVIVPPCKVGDTVYTINTTITCTHIFKGWDYLNKKPIYEIKKESFIGISEIVIPNIEYIFAHWHFFGKEIFLTREEAEQALKERAAVENE